MTSRRMEKVGTLADPDYWRWLRVWATTGNVSVAMVLDILIRRLRYDDEFADDVMKTAQRRRGDELRELQQRRDRRER